VTNKRGRKYRDVTIGLSGIPESLERRGIDSIIQAREQRAAEATEDARRAAELGITTAVYRRAKAAAAVAARHAELQRQLEVASAALADGPDDTDWTAVQRAYAAWLEEHGRHAGEPSKGELLSRSRMARDRFDAALRRHDVKDVRRLGAALRARGNQAAI
jgi:hypothetical protein